MTESELQVAVADYIRLAYPKVIFHSDYGSGVRLTPAQAIRQKRQNGGRRGWPDMMIAKPMPRPNADPPKNYWHGLMIELKKEGTVIYRKSDNKLVKNKHIQEQAEMLSELKKEGYAAEFAIGFDDAKAIIDGYLGGQYDKKAPY